MIVPKDKRASRGLVDQICPVHSRALALTKLLPQESNVDRSVGRASPHAAPELKSFLVLHPAHVHNTLEITYLITQEDKSAGICTNLVSLTDFLSYMLIKLYSY